MLFGLIFFGIIIGLAKEDDDLIEINRTLLDYSEMGCKDNPFLFLLPEQMRHTVEITFPKKPKKKSGSFCKNENVERSCCNSFTYDNIKTYLNDHIYTPKSNIFHNNLYFYHDIIKEHKRNFKKGFKISTEIYDELFEDYHKKVVELIEIGNQILNESVKYNWDAFCNYICNFPASLSNCEIYSVQYNKKGVHLFDFEYKCKGEKPFIENFAKKLTEFREAKIVLNKTIEGYYEEIKKKSATLVQPLLSSSKFNLYERSLNDGLYVSTKLNQPQLCMTVIESEIYEERLNNSMMSVLTGCADLLAKPCGLFSCMDDFFLQFYDTSENDNAFIVKQFNYSKITLDLIDNTSQSVVEENNFKFYHFDEDLKDLVGNKLKFESAFGLKAIGSVFYFKM